MGCAPCVIKDVLRLVTSTPYILGAISGISVTLLIFILNEFRYRFNNRRSGK